MASRILCLFFFAVPLCWSAEWDYDDFPAWNKLSQLCKNEHNQSPRRLSPNLALRQPYCAHIGWQNFQPRDFVVSNNGHSLTFTPILPTWESEANEFDFMGRSWCLVQFHFHWSQDGHGAEHQFGHNDHPLEVHFVHRDCDYKDLGAAIAEDTNQVNTVAVFGVVYEVGEDPLMSALINDQILTTGLRDGSATTVLRNFDYTSMLPPPQEREFYTYSGSLTTPPCDPVLWIVFSKEGKIPQSGLNLLRTIKDKQGRFIRSNQRPLQENANPLYLYPSCLDSPKPRPRRRASSSSDSDSSSGYGQRRYRGRGRRTRRRSWGRP